MRTTLSLDADVAERLREVQRARGVTFKRAVNDALRRGLMGEPAAASTEPYRMPVKDLKLRPGIDIDKIRDVLGDEDDLRFTG